MSADALDRDLAALDPASAYSPADADRAEHALALLLGAGVPRPGNPSVGTDGVVGQSPPRPPAPRRD